MEASRRFSISLSLWLRGCGYPQSRVMFLQAEHVQLAFLPHGRDGVGGGVCAGQRGEGDDVVLHSGAPDGALVVKRGASQRRIDYQVYLVALDQVNNVWAPLIDLEDSLGGNARFIQKSGRASRRNDPETEVAQPPGHAHRVLLVIVVDADER